MAVIPEKIGIQSSENLPYPLFAKEGNAPPFEKREVGRDSMSHRRPHPLLFKEGKTIRHGSHRAVYSA
jgi:hypothetical protein